MINNNDTRPIWHETFLTIAYAMSMRSQDPSTKVGAVIVADDNTIISTGYNGPPRGIELGDVEDDPRFTRPTKYKWFEHAERNAIYNAGRHGKPLDGATIYVPWLPCADCARAIVQSGITTVVIHTPAQAIMSSHRWEEDHKVTSSMFAEAGVVIIEWDGALPDIKVLMDGKTHPISGLGEVQSDYV